MSCRITPQISFVKSQVPNRGHYISTWPDFVKTGESIIYFPSLAAVYGIGSNAASAKNNLYKKLGWEPWLPGEYLVEPMEEDNHAFARVPPYTAGYVDKLLSEIIERHTEGPNDE